MEISKDQDVHHAEHAETLSGWACAGIGVGFIVAVCVLLFGALWTAG